MREKTHLALIHFPALDKTGKEISSAMTALDLHDLARLAKTYGLGGVFAQTNQTRQVELMGRLMEHWVTGFGADYNPNRREAIEILEMVPSLEDAAERLTARYGKRPLIAATSARLDGPPRAGCADARKRLEDWDGPALILFGTGWGLAPRVLDECDFVIEPIGSPVGYNHLSVRSAASITVDRLFG